MCASARLEKRCVRPGEARGGRPRYLWVALAECEARRHLASREAQNQCNQHARGVGPQHRLVHGWHRLARGVRVQLCGALLHLVLGSGVGQGGSSRREGLNRRAAVGPGTCRPPVTASMTREKAMSKRPYDESEPFFDDPFPRLKATTPPVMISTCAKAAWLQSRRQTRLGATGADSAQCDRAANPAPADTRRRRTVCRRGQSRQPSLAPSYTTSPAPETRRRLKRTRRARRRVAARAPVRAIGAHARAEPPASRKTRSAAPRWSPPSQTSARRPS